MTTSGYIDVYPIGTGRLLPRLRCWRMRRAGQDAHHTPRPTPDRWRRRWQAEHTGDHAHLGATRAWTRTGAFIRHARKIQRHEQA